MTNIFGGKVVDVSPQAVTIAVSGDPGKLYAFEMLVRPFGLLELSRTGRITLLRSDVNLDLPSLQEYTAGASPAELQQDSARAEAGALPSPALPAVHALCCMPCGRTGCVGLAPPRRGNLYTWPLMWACSRRPGVSACHFAVMLRGRAVHMCCEEGEMPRSLCRVEQRLRPGAQWWPSWPNMTAPA